MQFLFTFIFLLIPLVYSLPAASPKSGTDFDFNQEIETFVEQAFNQDDPSQAAAAASFEEFLVNVFNYDQADGQVDGQVSKVFEKRDANTEQTIEGILKAVNNSGVIWTLLDSVADDPSRIEYIGNLTSSFLKNYNITLNIADLLLESSSLTENLNITGLLSTVENSGLITSLLDGILLDENFRPRLVDLIDRLVLSQKNVLLYIFAGVLSKRDLMADGELVNVLLKRATSNDDSYSGSLGSFLNNAASTVLSSSLVSNAAADVLNALNDTGFLVYATKRFLSSDSYINMTVALVNDIVSSSSVTIDTSGLNITELISGTLGNPKEIAALVGSLLSGDSSQTSQLSNYLGRYSGALSQILQDLEKKGLFAELNSYIFGDSTTKASATATATATATSSANGKNVANNNNKDAATSGSATSNSLTSSNTKSASNGAGAVIYTGSNTQTTFLKALTILFGGALLFL
ncbi:PGA45, partial [Candida africana]